MKRYMNQIFSFMLLFLLLASCSGCIDTSKKTEDIDDDVLIVDGPEGSHFVTIQNAIDHCPVEGTIKVSPGIYKEHIQINRSLYLISDDSNQTIVDGNHTGDVIQVNAEHVLIKGFTLQHSGRQSHFQDYNAGIAIASNYTRVENCVFHNNTGGIEIRSDHNQIVSCHLHHNDFGIYALLSDNNSFEGNRIHHNNDEGIWIYSGAENKVIDENRFFNNDIGLKMKSSKENMVNNCLFQQNQQGLYFCCGSADNIISENSFINNSKRHVYDVSAVNTYYDAEAQRGNFWDDYSGVDADDDGIGDDPYHISNDQRKQDEYPLMHPLIS